MKQSLLEKAKAIPSQKRATEKPSQEMIDTALAWVHGEVSITQIARAMGLNNTGYRVYAKLALALKEHLLREERDYETPKWEAINSANWCSHEQTYCRDVEPKCEGCCLLRESSLDINGG